MISSSDSTTSFLYTCRPSERTTDRESVIPNASSEPHTHAVLRYSSVLINNHFSDCIFNFQRGKFGGVLQGSGVGGLRSSGDRD